MAAVIFNIQTQLLQGLISHDAVTGSNLGPRSPGSLINLLFRMANHNNSLFGGIQQAEGGVDAVIKSLEDGSKENVEDALTDIRNYAGSTSSISSVHLKVS